MFFIIGAFSLFLIFNWHKEPVDSYRLKIQSFFSKDAEFELYKRNFKKDAGYNRYERINYCSIDSNNDYYSWSLYDNYVYELAKYAELNVDEAKRELLWLANYERKNYPCPNRIRWKAEEKIRTIFSNIYIGELVNWIPRDSKIFKSQDIFEDDFMYINNSSENSKYNNYLIDIAAFYYDNNYIELGNNIVDEIMKDSKGYVFLDFLERKLSELNINSPNLLDLYRYLINYVDEIPMYKAKEYYTYRISEAILAKDQYNIAAKNEMQSLANQGYGYAIDYLYRNNIYLSSEEQKNLLLKIVPENETGSITPLHRLKNHYGIKSSVLERPSEQACNYGKTKNQACDTLLGRIYIENKKYDLAKWKYESLFENFDPTKYGKSFIGIEASKALGDIYYQGLGIRQDLEKAKYYFGIACDYKDQYSCTLYKEVNEKIR